MSKYFVCSVLFTVGTCSVIILLNLFRTCQPTVYGACVFLWEIAGISSQPASRFSGKNISCVWLRLPRVTPSKLKGFTHARRPARYESQKYLVSSNYAKISGVIRVLRVLAAQPTKRANQINMHTRSAWLCVCNIIRSTRHRSTCACAVESASYRRQTAAPKKGVQMEIKWQRKTLYSTVSRTNRLWSHEHMWKRAFLRRGAHALVECASQRFLLVPFCDSRRAFVWSLLNQTPFQCTNAHTSMSCTW